MEMPSDFERALMFEHIRKAAEAAYAKNPLDTEVRTPIFSHNACIIDHHFLSISLECSFVLFLGFGLARFDFVRFRYLICAESDWLGKCVD